MCHDKATVRACQYPPGPNAGETTLVSVPPPEPEGIDRRLVVRYGVALLTGGYTAIPTYAWLYYARLGVSEAEMVLIAQLCTYWWTERAPHPGEAALAARMGKTVRTIQGYLRSLEAKGFLHIETRLSNHGQQRTNSYDLRPFFAAVEGLARLDGLLDNTAAPELAPLDRESVACAEQGSLCAGARNSGADNRPTSDGTSTGEGGEGSRPRGVKKPSPQVNPVEIDVFDLDSMPPTPTDTPKGPATATSDPRPPELVGREGQPPAPRSPDTHVPALAPAAPEDDALAARVAAIGQAFGDEAPASSATRARALFAGSELAAPRFRALLDEAAGRTQARQDRITRMRRQGDRPNAMPYLFAVLADLLDPAPAHHRPAASDPTADHRRAGRRDRRHRRPDGGRDGGTLADPYAAWQGGVERLPLTEEHPVWRAALDELAQVMTAENYNAWLATTRAVGQEGELLRVAVPAAVNKAWLDTKLAGKVAGALRRLDYDALHVAPVARVEYVVDAAACTRAAAAARAS